MTTKPSYRPVTYDCGCGVTIHLCPEFDGYSVKKPEYWFIRRDLLSFDNQLLYNHGFRTLYWTENGWQHNTPMQFQTAEDAIAYHQSKINEISPIQS